MRVRSALWCSKNIAFQKIFELWFPSAISAGERAMGPQTRRAKRVALYLRVSTSEQTTRNQRRQLQAVAKRHGWQIVAVFEDEGISGAKGRDVRPGLDALLKAVARREVDMVAAWSVDRLGRSLSDLLQLLQELHSKNVDLFLHQQGLDTSRRRRSICCGSGGRRAAVSMSQRPSRNAGYFLAASPASP
jgi:hypothetical protein